MITIDSLISSVNFHWLLIFEISIASRISWTYSLIMTLLNRQQSYLHLTHNSIWLNFCCINFWHDDKQRRCVLIAREYEHFWSKNWLFDYHSKIVLKINLHVWCFRQWTFDWIQFRNILYISCFLIIVLIISLFLRKLIKSCILFQ